MTIPDFDRAIRHLQRRLEKIPGVRQVLLFGSVARGTPTEESDLDLLVVGEASKRGEVLEVTREVETETNAKISMIFLESLEGTDEQMLASLLREAVPLVGELPDFGVRQLDLEPWRLIRYDLSALNPREKVKLSRLLYGYRTRRKKGEKVYSSEHSGFVLRARGKRIGRGAFLIPESAASEADTLLRAAGATRIMIPVWIQRP